MSKKVRCPRNFMESNHTTITITASDITRRCQYNWISYITQDIQKNVVAQWWVFLHPTWIIVIFSCHAQEWLELYLYSPVHLHGMKSDNFIFAFTFTFTLQELKIISSLSSPNSMHTYPHVSNNYWTASEAGKNKNCNQITYKTHLSE
jgi:hypothetical protein